MAYSCEAVIGSLASVGVVARTISIEKLGELGADLERLSGNQLREALRAALRGDGGEALASEMKRRAPVRTGGLVSRIGVHTSGAGFGRDEVRVGYLGALSGGNKGGGRNQLGAWVESGTNPHKIRAPRGHAMSVNGQWLTEVDHPGARAHRVASRSLTAARWEVESAVVDEIDKMLGGGV